MKFILLSMIIGTIAFCAQHAISWQYPEAREYNWEAGKIIKVQTVDLAALLTLQQNRENVIADTRKNEYYNYGHIAGAINIPAFQDIHELSTEQLQKLQKASNIILYTTGSSNSEAILIARMLIESGIPQVQVYSSGWSQWKSCKLPVEGQSNVSR